MKRKYDDPSEYLQEDEFEMNGNHSDNSISYNQEYDTYYNVDDKAEKNRERNREHAKRTRLRKKEMIEGMKIRLLELQREVKLLYNQ